MKLLIPKDHHAQTQTHTQVPSPTLVSIISFAITVLVSPYLNMGTNLALRCRMPRKWPLFHPALPDHRITAGIIVIIPMMAVIIRNDISANAAGTLCVKAKLFVNQTKGRVKAVLSCDHSSPQWSPRDKCSSSPVCGGCACNRIWNRRLTSFEASSKVCYVHHHDVLDRVTASK